MLGFVGKAWGFGSSSNITTASASLHRLADDKAWPSEASGGAGKERSQGQEHVTTNRDPPKKG